MGIEFPQGFIDSIQQVAPGNCPILEPNSPYRWSWLKAQVIEGTSSTSPRVSLASCGGFFDNALAASFGSLKNQRPACRGCAVNMTRLLVAHQYSSSNPFNISVGHYCGPSDADQSKTK